MVKQIEGNRAAIRAKSTLLVSCLVGSVIHRVRAIGRHSNVTEDNKNEPLALAVTHLHVAVRHGVITALFVKDQINS